MIKLVIEGKVLEELKRDFYSPNSEDTKDAFVRVLLSSLKAAAKKENADSITIRLTVAEGERPN